MRETDMANSNDPPQDVTPYVLHTQQEENVSFRSKTDDIFGSLGKIEKKYQTDLTQRKDDDKKRGHDGDGEDDERQPCFKKPSFPSSRSKERRSESSSSRDYRDDGRDRNRDRNTDREKDRGHWRPGGRGRYDSRQQDRGSFSRPRGRFHQPDHKINPDKWTKYTLEDTCTYGDSFNRSVALDFISELRKRKEEGKQEDNAASGDGCTKIEFHKPGTGSSQDNEDSSGKHKNYGDVYRMSEYVVGMAKKPKPRHHTKTNEKADDLTASKSNLALNHLAEDDMDFDESTDVTAQTDQSDSKSTTETGQLDSKESQSSQSAVGEAELAQEKPQFKFGKGKGKRKIRARQEDEED